MELAVTYRGASIYFSNVLVHGNTDHIRALVEHHGLLDTIFQIVQNPELTVCALQMFSNLVVDGYLLHELGHPLIQSLIMCLASPTRAVKVAALNWVYNSAYYADNTTAEVLARRGLIIALVSYLDDSDKSYVCAAVEALYHLFSKLKEHANFALLKTQLEDSGGVNSLERLQTEGNEDLYNKCAFFLTSFFEAE
jgi:hypothetical protein